MFVGITRAQEEVQISRAAHRDFRGQRKTTIPSQFLMELPRNEMEVIEAALPAPGAGAREPYYEAPLPRGAATVRAATAPGGMSLTTAAELAGGASPPPQPDEFCQGMLVRHPAHGLGRIVALSGSGSERKATVDFASAAGRLRFVIARSPLRPVKNGPR